MVDPLGISRPIGVQSVQPRGLTPIAMMVTVARPRRTRTGFPDLDEMILSSAGDAVNEWSDNEGPSDGFAIDASLSPRLWSALDHHAHSALECSPTLSLILLSSMCPNQLSRVRPSDAAPPHIESDAISKRPSHAALVGSIIAQGSRVEAALIHLASAIMSADRHSVAAMLQKISNFRSRVETVRAASEPKLEKSDLSGLDAVLSIASKAMTQRNKIAHSIYGIFEDLPDAILLIELEAYVDMMLYQPEAFDAFDREAILRESRKMTTPSRNQIWVYKITDLQKIDNALINAANKLYIFQAYINSDDSLPQRKQQALRLLHAEPLIWKAMCRTQNSCYEDGWPILGQSPPS